MLAAWQKVAFRIAKGHLLACGLPSFRLHKATFCNLVSKLLTVSGLQTALQTVRNTCLAPCPYKLDCLFACHPFNVHAHNDEAVYSARNLTFAPQGLVRRVLVGQQVEGVQLFVVVIYDVRRAEGYDAAK